MKLPSSWHSKASGPASTKASGLYSTTFCPKTCPEHGSKGSTVKLKIINPVSFAAGIYVGEEEFAFNKVPEPEVVQVIMSN